MRLDLALPAALIAVGAVAWFASQPSMAVPDDRLTPGDVATADPDVICRMGYAATQRLARRIGLAGYAEVRNEVFMRYSVPYARRKAYQIDDRVPLCLGGRQSLGNLWPQPWGEARVKDKIEAQACRAACAAHTVEAVREWQARFLGDWRRMK
jgi:hypothetical protein